MYFRSGIILVLVGVCGNDTVLLFVKSNRFISRNWIKQTDDSFQNFLRDGEPVRCGLWRMVRSNSQP